MFFWSSLAFPIIQWKTLKSLLRHHSSKPSVSRYYILWEKQPAVGLMSHSHLQSVATDCGVGAGGRGQGSLCFPCWRRLVCSCPVSSRPGRGAASSPAACPIPPCAGLPSEPSTHSIFCDPCYTPGGKEVTVPISQMRTLRLRESRQPAGERLSQNHSRRVTPAVPVSVYKALTAELTGGEPRHLSASPARHAPPAGVSSVGRPPPLTAKSGAGQAGPRGPPTWSSSGS